LASVKVPSVDPLTTTDTAGISSWVVAFLIFPDTIGGWENTGNEQMAAIKNRIEKRMLFLITKNLVWNKPFDINMLIKSSELFEAQRFLPEK
jgi:hypothetical protein